MSGRSQRSRTVSVGVLAIRSLTRLLTMCVTLSALARAMPGTDVSQFRLPQSVDTINHFISRESSVHRLAIHFEAKMKATVYFENFHHQFPIIHLPTFDPSQSMPLLLAALICVGSCHSELSGARAFAVDLVEVLRKTLNALFEHDATNVSVDMFQTKLCPTRMIPSSISCMTAAQYFPHPRLSADDAGRPAYRQQTDVRACRSVSWNVDQRESEFCTRPGDTV